MDFQRVSFIIMLNFIEIITRTSMLCRFKYIMRSIQCTRPRPSWVHQVPGYPSILHSAKHIGLAITHMVCPLMYSLIPLQNTAIIYSPLTKNDHNTMASECSSSLQYQSLCLQFLLFQQYFHLSSIWTVMVHRQNLSELTAVEQTRLTHRMRTVGWVLEINIKNWTYYILLSKHLVTKGVSQGFVLEPLIFTIIYVSKIISNNIYSNIFLFCGWYLNN